MAQAENVNEKQKYAHFTLPLHSGFAKLVRDARKLMEIDQQDVVDRVAEMGIKISLRSYSSYERGQAEPKIGAARAILQVLGLHTEEEVKMEEVDIDVGPGDYMMRIIPIYKEGDEVDYYIRATYTGLTKEEGEELRRG